MICVWCLHDLYTVEKLLGNGGEIVISGVWGVGAEHSRSIGVSVVSVCWSIGGEVSSVYCQYLRYFLEDFGSMV